MHRGKVGESVLETGRVSSPEATKEVKLKRRRMSAPPDKLAPAPDFRHVGLQPGPGVGTRFALSVAAAGAGVGAALVEAFSTRAAVVAGLLAATGAAFSLRQLLGPTARKWGTRAVPMAIVPWGILLSHEEQPRVLHWAAITRVHVEMTYGRDQGTPSTLWSVITVETERERFAGRARGAVHLERLLVHLEAYAREASHTIALDLDGTQRGEGPLEPDCEPLLSAARAYVESAPGSSRLGLPSAGYRTAAARTASPQTLDVLRDVLCDRREKSIDPRPFAAIVASELGARDLLDEIMALGQSPHPVVAAVSRVAAHRLGASGPRVGALDAVAPFLVDRDLEVLQAWDVAS
jgi:hypothetical protein